MACYIERMTVKQLEIPSDLAAKLEERVAAGAADDAVAVIRDGLAALEAEDERKLRAVRAKIEHAISDPRPSVPANEAFDRVERLLSELGR